MTNGKSKISVGEILSQIIKNFIIIIKHTIILAGLELQLAGKSLLTILILSMVSGLFFLSFWVLACIALAMWLTTLHISVWLSFLIVAVLNLVLLTPLFLLIVKAKNRIRFSVLSGQISSYSNGETYEKINSETEKFTGKN
jgi:hypothetical protein